MVYILLKILVLHHGNIYFDFTTNIWPKKYHGKLVQRNTKITIAKEKKITIEILDI